ncbi:MAG: SPFH domain-containing protein [Peptoniphilaceae bacterium]|nr:SPFH domain-containing protein [Peptoniphilaceae bacterium]
MKEKVIKGKKNGMIALLVIIALYIASIAIFIWNVNTYEKTAFHILLLSLCIVWWAVGWIGFLGIKVVNPQEALVLTLFGHYTGTLKESGMYFVNPLSIAVNPAAMTRLGQSPDVDTPKKMPLAKNDDVQGNIGLMNKKISLKLMTLSNSKQKINDALGNPVEIGVAVTWRVVDTAKAVFVVDNYKEFLSLQADAAVRSIVKIYPYDVAPNIDTTGDGLADDGSLRGSTETVAKRIKEEIQTKVDQAGLEIVDARITYLAYASEIASAMLQRQQASAIIDARAMLVDGAVGMVEMALDSLSERGVVELDEERKAAMVSNLLVVLCSKQEAQPVVNSGSLY